MTSAAAQVPPPKDLDPALVAKGQEVFEQFRCLLCHKLGDEGGKIAKPLDSVGFKRDAASFRRFLEDPAAEYPDAKLKMPKFTLQDGQLEALVAYLRTLRKPAE